MSTLTVLLCPQLVMQYLYCGGTESLHIRNTEVMEVGRIPANPAQTRLR